MVINTNTNATVCKGSLRYLESSVVAEVLLIEISQNWCV